MPVPLNTLWKPADYQYVIQRLASGGAGRQRGAAAADRRHPARRIGRSIRHIIVVGSGESTHTHTHVRHAARAGRRRARRRADEPRRAGVLALLVGQHRRAEGLRAPAARHGRLRRAVRQGRARHPASAIAASASRSCSSPTASATRCRFRSRSARRRSSGRVRRRRRTCTTVIEKHRPTLFFSVPTGYGMMLAHCSVAGRARTSICRAIRLAVSAGEALPPALYERFKQRFGVDIIDGIGSTEALHMFISNRPGAIRPGSSGLIVTGYEARMLDDGGVPVPRRRDRQSVDQRRLGLRRATGISTRKRRTRSKGTGFAPATSTRRTRTATSGTRAAPTTC